MHTQGLTSHTWRAPPLDGSLTLPQILEWQLKKSPEHIAYVYDDPDGLVQVSMKDYLETVYKLSVRILRDLPESGSLISPVVGILASTDTISYCMLAAALMRLGLVPLSISPRSAPDGLANLLAQTNTVAVLAPTELRRVLSEATEILGRDLKVLDAPTFADVQATEADLHALPAMKPKSLDEVAYILHTSGSTSTFTKPVYLSHRMLLRCVNYPWTSTADHCGKVLAAQTLPNFHGLGVLLGAFPFTSGLTIAVLRPNAAAPAPPEVLLESTIATKADLLLTVPVYLETWSQTKRGVDALQTFETVCYVGASLNRAVGDSLVENGVGLSHLYGAMEQGFLNPFFVKPTKPHDWEYFSLVPGLTAARTVEPDTAGLYTHTYLITDDFPACFSNESVDGHLGCKLSDLLEAHPTEEGLHRVYGRSDDQITFSSGFKMNPVPLEAIITRNPAVEFAIMLGHGRTHPGVIIQLSFGILRQSEEVQDSIWASIQEANKTSPAHAQVTRKVKQCSPHDSALASMASADDESDTPTKLEEVPVAPATEKANSNNDFPDGGFRAWARYWGLTLFLFALTALSVPPHRIDMLFSKALLVAVALLPGAFAVPATDPKAHLVDQTHVLITRVHTLQTGVAAMQKAHPKAPSVARAAGHIQTISKCVLPPSGTIVTSPPTGTGSGALGDVTSNGLLGGCLAGNSNTLTNLLSTGGLAALIDNLLSALNLGGLLDLGGLLGGGSTAVPVHPGADMTTAQALNALLADLLNFKTECGPDSSDYVSRILSDTSAFIDALNAVYKASNPAVGGCGCGASPEVISKVNGLLHA
ncbi:Acetyl-CoA synthetase-like protein [Mycena kentingensis (nom. inval.)]|nr:Acetyl-CoA synthetase-like protein [Mycena kentingensis (nom. inval.)]